MKKIKKVTPPVIWAGIIFALSSIPHLRTPFLHIDHYIRGAAHFIVFFILTLLIAPNFKKTGKGRFTAVIIAAVYSVIDEYYQNFIPGRRMVMTDIIINWTGCISAFMVMIINDKFNAIKSSPGEKGGGLK